MGPVLKSPPPPHTHTQSHTRTVLPFVSKNVSQYWLVSWQIQIYGSVSPAMTGFSQERLCCTICTTQRNCYGWHGILVYPNSTPSILWCRLLHSLLQMLIMLVHLRDYCYCYLWYYHFLMCYMYAECWYCVHTSTVYIEFVACYSVQSSLSWCQNSRCQIPVDGSYTGNFTHIPAFRLLLYVLVLNVQSGEWSLMTVD